MVCVHMEENYVMCIVMHYWGCGQATHIAGVWSGDSQLGA